MGGDGGSLHMSGYSDRDLDLGGLQMNQKEVSSERASQRPPVSFQRPGMRRRVTGELITPANRTGALSPLNPKARTTSGLNTGIATGQPVSGSTSSVNVASTSANVVGAPQKGISGNRRATVDTGKKV
jgi:vacuole morphology and inheritance protein 14